MHTFKSQIFEPKTIPFICKARKEKRRKQNKIVLHTHWRKLPKPTTTPINTSHPQHPKTQRTLSLSPGQLILLILKSSAFFGYHGCRVGTSRRPPAPACTPAMDLLPHGVRPRRQCLPHWVRMQRPPNTSKEPSLSPPLQKLLLNFSVPVQRVPRHHAHRRPGEAVLPARRHRQQPHFARVQSGQQGNLKVAGFVFSSACDGSLKF